MSKPTKSTKKTPAKPTTAQPTKKKTGKVTQIDELELKKVTGGRTQTDGYSDPANN